MSDLTVEIYAPNGSDLIAEVAGWLDVTALEELDGEGGGSLTVTADNATLSDNPTLLDYRNIVKVLINGSIVAAWIIRKKAQTIVGEGGEASEGITVSGPDVRAWLDDAVLYPEFASPYSGTTRWFNWGSKPGDWFDGWLWGYPTRVKKRGGSDFVDPRNPFKHGPINWPATTPREVWWVWDRASAWSSAPAGDFFLRTTVYTAADDTDYRLYFTGKDVADAMIDGEPLVRIRDPKAYLRTYQADVTLDQGSHVLAIRARNKGGFAGVIAVLMQVSSNGEGDETMTPVVWTGGPGWRSLAYPAEEPGWTAGEVLGTLLDDAQGRNVLTADFIPSTGFGNAYDSDGVAWRKFYWSFTVGDTLTDVVRSMRDRHGVDVRIQPGDMTLDAFVSRGTDRTGSVSILTGTNITSATEEIDARIHNALLVATADDWVNTTDAASIAAYGRIEAYLDISSLEGASATTVMAAVLARAGIPAESVTCEFWPTTGCVPWFDFAVGDHVSVSTSSGTTSRKVVSIAVRSNPKNGQPDYTVEFDAVSREQIDRLQRIIDGAQVARGTIAGQASTPNQNGGGGNPGAGKYRPAPGPATNPQTPPAIPPDDPHVDLKEVGVGDVSKTVADAMIDVFGDYGDPLYIALCTAELTATSGEWDIGSSEQTGTNYARLAVPLTSFAAVTGNDPVTIATSVDLTFETNNGGTDWDPVTHLALWNNAQDKILSVITLPTPITVGPNEAPYIPAGWFAFEVTSV